MQLLQGLVPAAQQQGQELAHRVQLGRGPEGVSGGPVPLYLVVQGGRFA